MATFLDNLTCQPNESELQDLLQQLNQINKRIKMVHFDVFERRVFSVS